MQRKNKKYALENLAPYIRLLVQAAEKIIPLFWDRRKSVVKTTEDVATFPFGVSSRFGSPEVKPRTMLPLRSDALGRCVYPKTERLFSNPSTDWTSQGKN
jgi:hypothetical protein